MENNISCKYIGHATTLISVNGANILTDPNFTKRMFIFKRHSVLSDPSNLPKLDAILISHMHFDHFNISSFKYISKNIPIFVPEACAKFISKFISNPVIELSLYANHKLSNGLKITALPTKHMAGRISHLRYTKSNSYLIQKNDKNIFFCADSAYSELFKEIGNTAPIDLAILPIGGYKPAFLTKYWSMDPKQTVRAFEDLGAQNMIPIHWGTFKLSLEHISEPIEFLNKILSERKDLVEKIHIVPHGEKLALSR